MYKLVDKEHGEMVKRCPIDNAEMKYIHCGWYKCTKCKFTVNYYTGEVSRGLLAVKRSMGS